MRTSSSLMFNAPTVILADRECGRTEVLPIPEDGLSDAGDVLRRMPVADEDGDRRPPLCAIPPGDRADRGGLAGRAIRDRAKRALAFADPELAANGDSLATERNAVLQKGLRLGRLPYARRESRSIEQHLGGVDALVGRRASERELKGRALRDYDILHFAAHAVADEAHPERSAVLLSPGADGEDGLLQAREIEGLDLQGRIVVLSACETAAGAIQSGEGVLSLARAFFAAGAQAVIGTNWPIRDEDAALLFDAFYSKLAGGASLSEALAHAKVEAMSNGRPAATWASLVLLGDGAYRPFPGGRRQPPRPIWPVAAAVALSLAALIAVAGYSRTRRRSHSSARE